MATEKKGDHDIVYSVSCVSVPGKTEILHVDRSGYIKVESREEEGLPLEVVLIGIEPIFGGMFVSLLQQRFDHAKFHPVRKEIVKEIRDMMNVFRAGWTEREKQIEHEAAQGAKKH
jgi:hypothetical protein